MDGGESTVVLSSSLDDDRDSVKVIAAASVSPVPAEILEKVAKFVSGDPIADKQNPFKFSALERDETDSYPRRPVILTSPNPSKCEEDDDGADISTEDVLNESKYVKTYIKNPDKFFTLDTTNIKRIQREERNAFATKPIPVRRRLLNNHVVTKAPLLPTKGTKKRWISDKHSVYPDLADIKVRVGAAPDENAEYYNPAEVKFNAAQFDDRFKAIEFGSQDDIDTIAEKTEALDGDSSKEREQIITNNLRAEPKNKSYTNTVSSKDFQAYLRAKGLALVPMLRNGKATADATANKKPVMALRTIPASGGNEQPPVMAVGNGKKPSVFHRLLSRNRDVYRAPQEPIARNSHVPVNQRQSAPQFDHHYSNGGHPHRQRHSTPIKSTAAAPPMQPHRLDTTKATGRAILADNNRTNTITTSYATAPTTRENIYESTDRLQNLLRAGKHGVVLRNPQPIDNQVGAPPQPQQQQPLRSMPRNEIYAHLYAFYQKAKRNSVSSVEALSSPARSQSRNSGQSL